MPYDFGNEYVVRVSTFEDLREFFVRNLDARIKEAQLNENSAANTRDRIAAQTLRRELENCKRFFQEVIIRSKGSEPT